MIRKLHDQGARLIVFNLLFRESRGEEDIYLADTIRSAGNVLLQDYQEKRFIGSGVEIVDVTPPVSPLDSSTASAPMPVSDTDAATPRIWLFLNLLHDNQEITQSINQPILPVVALNLLALRQHQQILATLLQPFSASLNRLLSKPAQEVNQSAFIRDICEQLAALFKANPGLYDQLSVKLALNNDLSPDTKQLLQSLFRLYQLDNDFYLNPYGPSGTIQTIAYHQVDQAFTENPLLFQDKVIFIGPSLELGRLAKGGSINTPYGPISSTEMLATAFANLRANQGLRSLDAHAGLAIAIAACLLVLFCQLKLRPRTAFLVLCSSCVAYLFLVLWQFSFKNLLLPWLSIMLILSTGVIAVLISRYLSQRAKLTDILNASLPTQLLQVFNHKDFERMKQGGTHMGVCLNADGEGYTKLGDIKGEQWLAKFMLAYQPTVEHCIRYYQGAVKDWAGDGVVALWIETPKSACKLRFWQRQLIDADIRQQSMLAALALNDEIGRFNRSWGVHFPMRIGISYGPMWLSFVDELKAFGDTINTASRIEALNKDLKTRILVTEEMLENQDGLVYRRVGNFLIRGHQKRIQVFELLGSVDDVGVENLGLVTRFEQALDEFEAENLLEAMQGFTDILLDYPNDGPTLYYLQQLATTNRTLSNA